MGNLLRRLVARHGIFVSLSALLLGGFQYLMCAVVSAIDIGGAIEYMMRLMPPNVRAIVEEQFLGGLTPGGFLAFAWNHPIAQALGAAVAISLATRAVAGEIESGMMEIVLSQPISRIRYFTAHVVFALFALAAVGLAGIGGTMLGERVFGLTAFEISSAMKLALNYMLLQTVWYSTTLVASVYAREAGHASFTGFLLALISYVIQVIGRFWSDGAFLLPYTVYSYYSPQSVLVDNHLALKSVTILASISIVSIATALWRFRQRDIP